MGDQFLRHIERTRVLVHMIDVSNESRDPVSDYKAIVRELALFSTELLERKQLIVASKMDVLADRSRLSRLKAMCTRRRLPFLGVSAVTGYGIKELIGTLDTMLR